MKPCHENNGAAVYVGRAAILCFNVHSTVEYLNKNVSIGLLFFVQGQGQKGKQKHITKKFVRFHNHSLQLTMVGWTQMEIYSCVTVCIVIWGLLCVELGERQVNSMICCSDVLVNTARM